LESDGSPRAVYTISRQLFAPEEVRMLLGQAGPLDMLPDCMELDSINAMSVLEISGYMANTLLRDTDFMSMAHALEVRVPFIDPVVVSHVMSLRGDWKLDGGRPKPLLLDALAGLLPSEIWRRPKMGFALPFKNWMLSALQTDIERALSDAGGLDNVGLRADAARSIWRAFQHDPSRERWSHPWSLYVLTRWCEWNAVGL
jgi:asparagine synthase (glutamine-hydrolysing)